MTDGHTSDRRHCADSDDHGPNHSGTPEITGGGQDSRTNSERPEAIDGGRQGPIHSGRPEVTAQDRHGTTRPGQPEATDTARHGSTRSGRPEATAQDRHGTTHPGQPEATDTARHGPAHSAEPETPTPDRHTTTHPAQPETPTRDRHTTTHPAQPETTGASHDRPAGPRPHYACTRSRTGAVGRGIGLDTLVRLQRRRSVPDAPRRLTVPEGMTASLGWDAVAVPDRLGPLVVPRLPRLGCVYADGARWWWIVPSDSDYALPWPFPAHYAPGALITGAARLIHRPDGTVPYTPPIPLYLALCRATGTTPDWSLRSPRP